MLLKHKSINMNNAQVEKELKFIKKELLFLTAISIMILIGVFGESILMLFRLVQHVYFK